MHILTKFSEQWCHLMEKTQYMATFCGTVTLGLQGSIIMETMILLRSLNAILLMKITCSLACVGNRKQCAQSHQAQVKQTEAVSWANGESKRNVSYFVVVCEEALHLFVFSFLFITRLFLDCYSFLRALCLPETHLNGGKSTIAREFHHVSRWNLRQVHDLPRFRMHTFFDDNVQGFDSIGSESRWRDAVLIRLVERNRTALALGLPPKPSNLVWGMVLPN